MIKAFHSNTQVLNALGNKINKKYIKIMETKTNKTINRKIKRK